MKLIKIKLGTKFLEAFGLPNYFSELEYIELVQIYQYDRLNFFSLQRMLFKPNRIDHKEEIIKNLFQATFFQQLEQNGNELLCIMKQRNDLGFWPLLISGSWGLIPPLSVDPHSIMISIIVKEENMQSLFEALDKYTQDSELLAVTDVVNAMEKVGVPLPSFTGRQHEIMAYATRHGYFDIPRKCSTEKIAEKFGVSVAAINEHMRKVERTVMRYFFG